MWNVEVWDEEKGYWVMLFRNANRTVILNILDTTADIGQIRIVNF